MENDKTNKSQEHHGKGGFREDNLSNVHREEGDIKSSKAMGSSEHDIESKESPTNTQNQFFHHNFESNFNAVQAAELEHSLKHSFSKKPQQVEPVPPGPGNVCHKKTKMREHHPLYYGIKSYIHDFYSPPDKDVLKSGEYIQGDDFRFLAEPRQNDNCWVRMGLWVGVNLILMGIIATAVGYLTPPHEAIVGNVEGFTIVDRWAISFNHRLLVCQLSGLITLVCGAVIVVCAVLASCCQYNHPRPRPLLPTYYVMGATLLPETFVGSPSAASDSRLHTIPTSKTIRGVQPAFVCPHY